MAFVSLRLLRSVSACALPRPSATASAKLANSTVNHSQNAIWPENSGEVGVRDEIADEKAGDDQRNDLGDEDHRIFRQRARIELAERVDRRRADDLGIEQSLNSVFRGHGFAPIQKGCDVRRPCR